MTFKEAQQVIKDNDKSLYKYTLHSNPPHIIQCVFIAPASRLLDREILIFEKCFDEGANNEQVLEELNLSWDDLIPFVAIKIWGNTIIIPVSSYIASTLNNESGKDV